MNKGSISNISLTDWERVDRLTDEEIDTSEIPILDDEWFAGATIQWPEQDKEGSTNEQSQSVG